MSFERISVSSFLCFSDATEMIESMGMKYEMPRCVQQRTSIFSQHSNFSAGLCASLPSVNSGSETEPSQPRQRGSDSGVITNQPSTNSQSQKRGPRRRSNKNSWESYLASKPLTAGESNSSRLVSSKRHSIEVSHIFWSLIRIYRIGCEWKSET